jgi:hypothetical protein
MNDNMKYILQMYSIPILPSYIPSIQWNTIKVGSVIYAHEGGFVVVSKTNESHVSFSYLSFKI